MCSFFDPRKPLPFKGFTTNIIRLTYLSREKWPSNKAQMPACTGGELSILACCGADINPLIYVQYKVKGCIMYALQASFRPLDF